MAWPKLDRNELSAVWRAVDKRKREEAEKPERNRFHRIIFIYGACILAGLLLHYLLCGSFH